MGLDRRRPLPHDAFAVGDRVIARFLNLLFLYLPPRDKSGLLHPAGHPFFSGDRLPLSARWNQKT
jgi:hypothetical protein